MIKIRENNAFIRMDTRQLAAISFFEIKLLEITAVSIFAKLYKQVKSFIVNKIEL